MINGDQYSSGVASDDEWGNPEYLITKDQLNRLEECGINPDIVAFVELICSHPASIRVLQQERERIREAQPTIVCLCGSTRFSDAFRQANLTETLAGKIVLSIGCDFKSDDALGLTTNDKCRMDELHKRKIDLCDEILVLNVGKYIGESTRSEIEYAVNRGKNIRYLEPDDKETGWCIV